MSEREQPPAAGARSADGGRDQTIPAMQPVRTPWADGAPSGPEHVGQRAGVRSRTQARLGT